MKKILFALLCSGALTAAAQDAHFGIKAGLNVASLDIENNNTNSRLGFHGGFTAHFHLNNKWAIQPELLYSGQGTELQNDVEYKLGYINVPVMFQYMFNNGFRLQGGPQVGFLTTSKAEFPNGTEVDLDLKFVDFGLGLGLGYLTNSGLGIDARYNFGLSNINEDDNMSIQNRVFQLGLFYMLDKDHKRKSR